MNNLLPLLFFTALLGFLGGYAYGRVELRTKLEWRRKFRRKEWVGPDRDSKAGPTSPLDEGY